MPPPTRRNSTSLLAGPSGIRSRAVLGGSEERLQLLLVARVEHGEHLVAGFEHRVRTRHEALAATQDRDQEAPFRHVEVADTPSHYPGVLAQQHLDDLQLLLLQVEQVNEAV